MGLHFAPGKGTTGGRASKITGEVMCNSRHPAETRSESSSTVSQLKPRSVARFCHLAPRFRPGLGLVSAFRSKNFADRGCLRRPSMSRSAAVYSIFCRAGPFRVAITGRLPENGLGCMRSLRGQPSAGPRRRKIESRGPSQSKIDCGRRPTDGQISMPIGCQLQPGGT